MKNISRIKLNHINVLTLVGSIFGQSLQKIILPKMTQTKRNVCNKENIKDDIVPQILFDVEK
jgi:hypothetical protein